MLLFHAHSSVSIAVSYNDLCGDKWQFSYITITTFFCSLEQLLTATTARSCFHAASGWVNELKPSILKKPPAKFTLAQSQG